MTVVRGSRYVLVAAAAAALNCGDACAQKRGTMVTLQQAQKIVQEQAQAAGYPSSAPQTPAFPSQWPPAAGTRASFFVYSRSRMSTSVVRHQIHSPQLRVDIDLANPSQPVVTHLESKPLTSQAQGVPSSIRAAELNEAQQILFDAISSGAAPAGDSAARLKKGYKAWMTANRALADEISKSMPEFTRWVEEQP